MDPSKASLICPLPSRDSHLKLPPVRQRRKANRSRFGVTCTVHASRGGVGTNAVIREISTLGCEVRLSGTETIGEKCELYFEWRGNYFGLVGRVVWKDAHGRLGLSFLSLDQESRSKLEQLCAALESQPGLSAAPQEAAPAGSAPAKAHSKSHSVAPSWAAIPPPPKPHVERKRRELPRYECELTGQLSNPATGTSSHVKLRDISLSGGLVEGAELPEMGQACELQTEWEGRRLTILAAVTWKGPGQVGIRFSPRDEETGKLLKRICANSRLLRPSPAPL